MRTGHVATEAGVNVQTLRYYERRGLLPPPPLGESGYRSYGADAVSVVRFIKRAQELGLSLSEVETLLGLADGGPAGCEAVRVVAQHKLDDLEEKIANLQSMRVSLQRPLANCERPRRRRECPLTEGLGGFASMQRSPQASAPTTAKGAG